MSNIGISKILIIGSNGMLGQRLVSHFSEKNIDIKCLSNEESSFLKGTDYQQIDLIKPAEVLKIISEYKPEIIINAAAYTAVDKAEIERDLAYAINCNAVKEINLISKKIGAHFINISTDYVFDGLSGPYSENDPVNPVGYYGQSKLDGENALIESGGSFAIIRTNVLYGPAKFGRPDFVKWVVNSLQSGNPIKIVTDQINNPTYLDDLVSGIYSIALKKLNGIYHIGGSEFLSRYDFTLRIAKFFELDQSLITPIVTEELNQPANRPLKSGLKIDKAKKEFGYKPKSIEETFELMQKELNLV